MKMMYVLYNPLSGNQSGREGLTKLETYFPGVKMEYRDIRTVDNYEALLSALSPEDGILVCGGDGTLNRFVNEVYHLKLTNPVYYYATGSGNDFLRDIGADVEQGPVQVNTYIENLPSVTVNGKTYRFVNGVGYGIDGYCCEVGDQQRSKGIVPNYTSIAIKGLLFHYESTNAVVTVDGKKYTYKRVWIAPTMYGRYYGGGMMATPAQDRNDPEGKVSALIMHNTGRLGILCVFPSIFKGKHINHKKVAAVHAGHDITVEFDRPVTLQIDGETIFNVTKYRACSAVPVKK